MKIFLRKDHEESYLSQEILKKLKDEFKDEFNNENDYINKILTIVKHVSNVNEKSKKC